MTRRALRSNEDFKLAGTVALTHDLALRYFLDDIPSARQLGTRLHGVLTTLEQGKTLTPLQEGYLEASGHCALLSHARGLTSYEAFARPALREQKARVARPDGSAPCAATGDRRKAEHAEWLAESQKHNAKLFEAAAQRKVRRRVFDDLNFGYIDRDDFPRVSRIAHGVSGGTEISEADLLWLAGAGASYKTEALMSAHHRIVAGAHVKAWAETGDPWEAVSACANWRKGERPEEGLAISGQALAKTREPRPRSALCTTRGGALRDLGRPGDATTIGLEAHALNGGDFRPCTLLGACCIELGDYQAATEWYEKAEARGASRKAIDTEIRAILLAVPPARRDEIRKALRTLDRERFGMLTRG